MTTLRNNTQSDLAIAPRLARSVPRYAWPFSADQVLSRITLPFGWKFTITDKHGTVTLQITNPKPTCNVTGQPTAPWRGRKWLLSEHMTDGEIVQTAFMATLAAVEHEVRELFLYRGLAVLDPHYDIEKLVELRASPDALKERSSVTPTEKA